MKTRFTSVLALVLSFSLVASADASEKKAPFLSLGDSGARVPSVNEGVEKGLFDCSGAIPVELDQSYFGNTNTGVNNVSFYGCSFFDESGPELVYVLTLTEPKMFSVDLIPEAGVDLDLAVLDQCDEDLGCILVADFGVVTNAPLSGTFYFVVDGYNGVAGSFELVFTEIMPPPPASACDRVEQPLPGNEGDILVGSFPLSGDTCGGENTISLLDCADYTENGLDNWYEFVLLPGASIEATITSTADGALWIVDACAEPFTCLGYADATLANQPETVGYVNTTGQQQVVHLVVDSWGTDTCGTFSGSVVINPPGVIDNDSMSFGEIKARF
jgi:hypothetical protein